LKEKTQKNVSYLYVKPKFKIIRIGCKEEIQFLAPKLTRLSALKG